MAELGPYIEMTKKYAADFDIAAMEKIVKHLGIALQSRDSSLVSCSDPEELKTVRESWLKNKLGATQRDDELDSMIEDVCATMKDEKSNKSRVTFYYLLAEKMGKLSSL